MGCNPLLIEKIQKMQFKNTYLPYARRDYTDYQSFGSIDKRPNSIFLNMRIPRSQISKSDSLSRAVKIKIHEHSRENN
jgi:hypothetical protein